MAEPWAAGSFGSRPQAPGQQVFIGIHEVERHAHLVGGGENGGLEIAAGPEAKRRLPVIEEGFGAGNGVFGQGAPDDGLAVAVDRCAVVGGGQDHVQARAQRGQAFGQLHKRIGATGIHGMGPDHRALGARDVGPCIAVAATAGIGEIGREGEGLRHRVTLWCGARVQRRKRRGARPWRAVSLGMSGVAVQRILLPARVKRKGVVPS